MRHYEKDTLGNRLEINSPTSLSLEKLCRTKNKNLPYLLFFHAAPSYCTAPVLSSIKARQGHNAVTAISGTTVAKVMDELRLRAFSMQGYRRHWLGDGLRSLKDRR